jgi:hypothetical protein
MAEWQSAKVMVVEKPIETRHRYMRYNYISVPLNPQTVLIS